MPVINCYYLYSSNAFVVLGTGYYFHGNLWTVKYWQTGILILIRFEIAVSLIFRNSSYIESKLN